jgi:hypothetical protein
VFSITSLDVLHQGSSIHWIVFSLLFQAGLS